MEPNQGPNANFVTSGEIGTNAMHPPGKRSIGINKSHCRTDTHGRAQRPSPTQRFNAVMTTPPHTHQPSHARAPVFQLQINTGAAAEDIQGWVVGDINQAAGADLVVPLFRAEADCLEGLARARELDT